MGTIMMADDGSVLVTLRRLNWAIVVVTATLVILAAMFLAVLVSTAHFHDAAPPPPAPMGNCQPFCSAAH